MCPADVTRADTTALAGGHAQMPAGSRSSWRRLTGALLGKNALLIAWAVVIAVFGVWVPNTFLTTANFQTLFGSQAILLILTLGLLPALMVGLYDLSVAGTLGLALVLIGKLNVQNGWPIGFVVLVVLTVGLAVGALNAFVIVKLGVDSFVTTLGVGTALYGAAYAINDGSVSGISHTLVQISSSTLFGIQLAFYYGLALTVVMWYVIRFTPLGRALFMTGANFDVARLSGLRVESLRAGALLFSGFIAALAGVILGGLLGSAEPNVGSTYLLPAFAGAFLGATTVTPGRFNAWGTFVAIYFLVTGITGLELVGESGWITQVFYGGALVIAIVFGRVVGMKRRIQ